MTGMKSDWSSGPAPQHYDLSDYEGGVPRWCPGCGDQAVLTAVKRILRDEQVPPEKIVCVSGIGCSSRFPHYMSTYGFHGLHGRALPVACGVKSRRPDLDVWVATGDGDCCSIGAGHWIHAVRYNMNITVMLFDNNIYGLTKNQTSPTTPQGLATSTHPEGAFLPPLNPVSATLGFTNVSFVAQTVDWDPTHLHATLKAAHRHQGFSFVRILQRCPTFTPGIFDHFQNDPDRVLLLMHKNGVDVEPAVARRYRKQLIHDPLDGTMARFLAERLDDLPIGLLYCDPDRPTYNDFTERGIEIGAEAKLMALERELDRFTIQKR